MIIFFIIYFLSIKTHIKPKDCMIFGSMEMPVCQLKPSAFPAKPLNPLMPPAFPRTRTQKGQVDAATGNL